MQIVNRMWKEQDYTKLTLEGLLMLCISQKNQSQSQPDYPIFPVPPWPSPNSPTYLFPTVPSPDILSSPIPRLSLSPLTKSPHEPTSQLTSPCHFPHPSHSLNQTKALTVTIGYKVLSCANKTTYLNYVIQQPSQTLNQTKAVSVTSDN